MAGLEKMPEHFVVQSSEAVRIEFSSQAIGVSKVAVEQDTNRATETMEATTATITEDTSTMPSATVPERQNRASAEPSAMADTLSTEKIEPTKTTEQPVVVVDQKESEKRPLKLPKAVGEENINACNRYFEQLSEQQKQRVLLVFYAMLKTGTIRNNANYFIGLCKSAKTDSLTIPTGIAVKKTQTAKQVAAEKERIRRQDLWSDYTCIQQFATAEKVSEIEIAKRLGMEEAYEMYASLALQAA